MRSTLAAAAIVLFLPCIPFLLKTALVTSPSATVVAGARSSAVVDDSGLATEANVDAFRAELLMGLDLFVRAQRILHTDSSTYTRALGRMPDVLGSLTHYYRIEVAKATRSQLLVLAAGEGRRGPTTEGTMLVGDRVSVDEGFHVRSNFPMPKPPRDYLHVLARTVLNKIFSNQFKLLEPQALALAEGIFQGYFRYEIQPVSQGGRTIVAIGLKAPVQNDVVEMQPGADLFEWVYGHRQTIWSDQEFQANLAQVYSAQAIHQGHSGSYAPTLRALVPSWHALSAYSLDLAPFVVQEFQLDPTFGYHAELALRPGGSGREPSSFSADARIWSVNGYGQFLQVSTIEGIMNQFERTQRDLQRHGELSAGENAKSRQVFDVPAARKPLLIDPVDGASELARPGAQ